MSETETENPAVKEHNTSLAVTKIHKKIQRAHEWRVQVWAQQELRLRALQGQLDGFGVPRVELMKTDFSDDQLLDHYSTMKITK